MKLIITAPTIIGGIDYQPDHRPQDVPANVGEHLVEIGNATPYETKVVKPTEKKTLSSAPAAPASPKATAKKRRGRPRKS